MYSQLIKLDASAVAEAMLRRGLLRRELQERSGLSHFTIWKACNRKALSLATAKRIAKALRVSLASLIAQPVGGGAGDQAGGGLVEETLQGDGFKVGRGGRLK